MSFGSGQSALLTAAGPGGGPDVGEFRAVDAHELDHFFALESRFTGGLFIAG